MEHNEKNTFNKNLYNLSEIARQIGISPSYVSKILKGHRKSGKYSKMIMEIIKDSQSFQKQNNAEE